LDGRFLLYQEQDPKSKWDLWVLPVSNLSGAGVAVERKPIPLLRTEFDEVQGQFSPDAKWIAYVSNESGQAQVYVRSFDPEGKAASGKWQISIDGGAEPAWRRDSKELFYLAPDFKLMAVDINIGAIFEHGIAHALFQAHSAGTVHYRVAADGKRFLVNTPVEEVGSAPAAVVLNWSAALKKGGGGNP
jgi:hypothetical protein